MSGQKRKLSSDNLVEYDEVTKISKPSDGNTSSLESHTNGINIEATQEYDLEDSEGFDLDLNEPCSTEEVENTTEDKIVENQVVNGQYQGKKFEMSVKTRDQSSDIHDALPDNEIEIGYLKKSCSEGTEKYTPDLEDLDDIDNEEVYKLQREETETYSQEKINDVSSVEKKENAENSVTSLQKIGSVLQDAELVSGIVPGVKVEEVYDKILKRRKEKNRADIVMNEILEHNDNAHDVSAANSGESVNDKVFQEVAEVLVVRPSADPSRVYDLLEQLEQSENRIEAVLSQLTPADDVPSKSASEQTAVSSSSGEGKDTEKSKADDPFSDPGFKSNPLYRDFRTLKKVLPDKQPAEIYAFLEAHYDKPNRVQLVIDELTKSESQESLPLNKKDSFEDLDRGKAPMTVHDKFNADLKELKDIFRDCDPNFLYQKLEEKKDGKDRVQTIAAVLFETKNYPKLKDVLEKEEKIKRKNKVTQMDFEMQSFLKKFPNPVEYFSDTARIVNQNYKDHVLVYLKNSYPYLKEGFFKKVLEKHSGHLAPVVAEIEGELPNIMERPSKKKRATPRDSTLEYPEDPDEPFFQELMFCQYRQQIVDYLAEQTLLKNLKLEEARKRGELLECGCCYDDECLFEDMAACADGHIFCKECVRRSSEAAIGEGKTKFLCLSGNCESEFPLSTLQDLLSPTTFSLALRKMQEEELRLADIPDLVSCPFCSFATIMPDPEDKVFKCLNQECLKESCRLCKEPNHIPLKCNEVEKQSATNMRTYIEMKVSEAMLRICPRCKKRFYKAYGCNKMTCTCGTTMCYVCRKPDIDYDHFDNAGNGGCAIDSDIEALHQIEMEEAAQKAKEEYLRDHPDQGQDIGFGTLLDKMKKNWERMEVDVEGADDDDDMQGEDDYSDDDNGYEDYY